MASIKPDENVAKGEGRLTPQTVKSPKLLLINPMLKAPKLKLKGKANG